MLEQHVHLAIGTDGCASADHQNLFEAIRLAAYIHRPLEPDYEAWPRAAQVLEAAWDGGAHTLGLAGKLGRIAPGYLADMVLLDLDSEPLTPLNHAANQLVMCENGQSVRIVIVDGRIVFEHGKTTLVDCAEIKARARETARRLARTNVDRARIISSAEPALRAARFAALASPTPGLP
jgi:5-methylthioadenosine/S-adenosylhomocysteine deaminase